MKKSAFYAETTLTSTSYVTLIDEKIVYQSVTDLLVGLTNDKSGENLGPDVDFRVLVQVVPDGPFFEVSRFAEFSGNISLGMGEGLVSSSRFLGRVSNIGAEWVVVEARLVTAGSAVVSASVRVIATDGS